MALGGETLQQETTWQKIWTHDYQTKRQQALQKYFGVNAGTASQSTFTGFTKNTKDIQDIYDVKELFIVIALGSDITRSIHRTTIYKLINELAQNGIGIILFSSEVPEICGMSDKIIVLYRGKIVKEVAYDQANEIEIQRLVLSGR